MAEIAEIVEIAEMKSMVEGEVIPIIYGENAEQALRDEETIRTTSGHWYSEFSEFLGSDIIPLRFTHLQRQAFFSDLKFYTWEDPFLYYRCSDGMIRRCAMEFQIPKILEHCHVLQADGYNGAVRTTSRVL